MKKNLLFLSLLAMMSLTSTELRADNPVLTIEGGKVQGVLADDHPDV